MRTLTAPAQQPCQEAGSLRLGFRWIRILDPEFLRAKIQAVAEALLRLELPIAPALQELDHGQQRGILSREQLGRDTDRFIAQQPPVALPHSFELDRPAESPHPIVKSGQLMLITARSAHTSCQRAKHRHKIAQRDGLIAEHGSLRLNGIA